MGKIVEYTGNYVEVIKALNLSEGFYSEQETKKLYTDEIEKDLGRTDFFSLKSSRAELQNRIRRETDAQTHFSYAQGNFDGRIFSKPLMGFQPGILLQMADKADDPYFTKTIGLNYVDDKGIQCGFAISAYRNDSNLDIPSQEREYFYIITRIENVNLEPEKRKVTVISNISDIANHESADPESKNYNGIQPTEYNSNPINEKIDNLVISEDLSSLLTNVFDSEGSLSFNKLNELVSRFGSTTLDNRDFKIKHINSFINFAETYLKQDEKLQKDITQLKNDISSDVNLFKGEGTDNLIISRLHDLISKSIKTYKLPETADKLLKANDLNLFIYNLEQQYSHLQKSKILNVSKEENQQFRSKINILRHYAQYPFNVDIDELPEIKSVNNFDKLIKSTDLIVIDYDQMLSILENSQEKMPHLADSFADEIERLIIDGNNNQSAPNNNKSHLSRLIDIINKGREQELSSIKSPSEVIAPIKPEGTFFKRNGTALSIGIAAIIGTIGIALTLTGILAPLGIALSGIGFTLGLLGLGLGAGVSLVSAGSIIAKENNHQAQLEKYPHDKEKYDADVKEFNLLREKNNEAKIEINDRYYNSIKLIDESIINIIGTPNVQDKPDEFLDNAINIKASKDLEVNEDNKSDDLLNILSEPEDPSDLILKSTETSYQSEAKARSTVTTLDKLFSEGENALQQAKEIQLNPKVTSAKETKKVTILKETNEEDIETPDHKFN
ncbi:MAG: hypothetical protein Q8M40_13930 [Legionella sp.]|nr:hypothetical protein [Legionella sp.]